MAGNGLSISLQENLLVLLCFDEASSLLIRNSVEPHLFSSAIYRDIISRVYDFIDQYKRPPGDHLSDLLEDQLASDKPSAKLYLELLEAVHDQRNNIKADFTMQRLEDFVRKQTLKNSIIQANDAIQDEDLDKAEEILNNGLKTRLNTFSPGLDLTQGLDKALAGSTRQDVVITGLNGMDEAQFGPGRGELHLFIGPPKRGKSWWLVHMARQCLLGKYKVAVITLELSEPAWTQRLIQCLFSIPQQAAKKIAVTRIKTDDAGRLLSIERDDITGRMALTDPHAGRVLHKKLERFHARDNVVVKRFPASTLTVRGLNNYLDMLERSADFVPDFVIIDYPKYMHIDPDNYRIAVGLLYDQLRGMAVERNCGVIVASESNREGAKSKMVTETHAGEDYSRIFTADSIVTYSQTLDEKKIGLARLFASNSRVALRDGFVLMISQAYQIGQFCLDSVHMGDNYFGLVEDLARGTVPPGANDEERN